MLVFHVWDDTNDVSTPIGNVSFCGWFEFERMILDYFGGLFYSSHPPLFTLAAQHPGFHSWTLLKGYKARRPNGIFPWLVAPTHPKHSMTSRACNKIDRLSTNCLPKWGNICQEIFVWGCKFLYNPIRRARLEKEDAFIWRPIPRGCGLLAKCHQV